MLFLTDGSSLKPKVGLGPKQMKIDLRKVFMENITYFSKNKTIFIKERPRETLSVCTHKHVCVRVVKPCVHMLTICACMHGHAYATKVIETMKGKVFYIKLGLERIPYRLGAAQNSFFLLCKAIKGTFSKEEKSGKIHKIH